MANIVFTVLCPYWFAQSKLVTIYETTRRQILEDGYPQVSLCPRYNYGKKGKAIPVTGRGGP
jgi:hypothetical protein